MKRKTKCVRNLSILPVAFWASVVLGKIERNYQISRNFKIFRHKLQEYGHGVMFSRRFDSGISLLKARIFSKGSKFFPVSADPIEKNIKENGRIAFPENVSIYHKLFIQRFVKMVGKITKLWKSWSDCSSLIWSTQFARVSLSRNLGS